MSLLLPRFAFSCRQCHSSVPLFALQGCVYLVWEYGFQDLRAMKTIPADKHLLGPLLDEALTLLELPPHPNVVRVDFLYPLRPDSKPSLAGLGLSVVLLLFLEHASGGSVAEKMADGSLYEGSEREVMSRLLLVILDSARGLAHLHDQGIAHFDVKVRWSLLAVALPL